MTDTPTRPVSLTERASRLHDDLRQSPDLPIAITALTALIADVALLLERLETDHADLGGEVDSLQGRIDDAVTELEGKIRDEISAHVDDSPHAYPDGSS